MAALQSESPRNNARSHRPHERDDSLLSLASVSESRATVLYRSGDVSGALAAAIKAADLYLKAAAQSASARERETIDKKCSKLLATAERWKREKKEQEMLSQGPKPPPAPRSGPKNGRKLSVSEQMILLRSSLISGTKFPPWKGPPTKDEFDGDSFLDNTGLLKLSDAQKDVLDEWKRPNDLCGNNARMFEYGKQLDLTQDIITDCSVVASLCSATRREELGFGKTITRILYPQDEKGGAIPSPSGKYIVRLFFNGCWRKVIIDDFLPSSKTSRSLYVLCRNNPGSFGCALIEKAYLKLMGGYDFPGSNSGTDLLTLTGWVPEHLFLQRDDIIFSSLWSRIRHGWRTGDVMITLGTGKMDELEESHLGLIGHHDYSVLDLKEKNGGRYMLVKNPWSNGVVWRGVAPNSDEEDEENFDAPITEPEEPPQKLQPGVFWIPFENVCRYFESMYLNWNPGIFTHLQETHFRWDLATKVSESSFGPNPQFSISNKTNNSGPVFVMLSRHIGLSSTGTIVGNGYISLYLFDHDGQRVYISSGSIERLRYVDSPQNLLRIEDFPANTTYTLVVSSMDLPKEPHHFSLAVYSLLPLRLEPATEPHPYSATLTSSWTSSTSGGNVQSPGYPTNPQFKLTLPTCAESIALLLECECTYRANICLVRYSGSRAASILSRDIIVDSGAYGESTVLVTVPNLSPGTYTAIASTFEPGQLGKFNLTLLSTAPDAVLVELPAESAGRFETKREGSWTSNRVIVPMEVGRLTKVWVKANTKSCGYREIPALRISIERGDPVEGMEKVVVTSEGGFKALPMGVRTAPVDLVAGQGEYHIVLERIGGGEVDWEVVVVSEWQLWVGETEEDED